MDSLGPAFDHIDHPHFLGKVEVVQSLLRTYAHQVLTQHPPPKEIIKGAENLARVFLGEDPNYPGSKWNSPGHIDKWLERKVGVTSTQPHERVAGALIRMVRELLTLTNQIRERKLLEEQWQPAVDEILEKYDRLFLGMGWGGGFGGSTPTSPKPKSTLPSG